MFSTIVSHLMIQLAAISLPGTKRGPKGDQNHANHAMNDVN